MKRNLIQNSPAVKGVWPWRIRRPLWKKMWNPRWWPRNGCDDRLMVKAIIQANLVPNPSEMWRRQHKFTWIVIIKVFAIRLPSQPFLSRHLVYFHNILLQGCTLFYSWAILPYQNNVQSCCECKDVKLNFLQFRNSSGCSLCMFFST